MKTKLCHNLAWSSPSGAGRVISKHVKFANAAVLTVSNTYFLVPVYRYCSGQLIHCLKISINKNNLRLKSPKKLRTAQPEPKVTGSYKKKSVYTRLL